MSKNIDKKITNENIQNCNLNIFGDWINNKLKCNTQPISYILIDNFLNDTTYKIISKEYPDKPDKTWWKYENPLEVKYANDNISEYPENTQNLFYALSHHKIITKLENIFNIPNLEYDPYCHGGGLHMMPKYGRLNMHLDYEIHPITNKKRRLNIILYMNDEWNESWNGDTQLWDKAMSKCMVKSFPKGNRALIFVTNDNSWHGIPDKIICPEDVFRKTIAFYYVSENDNKKLEYRRKASFVKRPNDNYDERLEKLFNIRPNRRIEQEDLDNIWPEWNKIKY